MSQEVAIGLGLAFLSGLIALSGLLWAANGDIIGAAMLAARMAGCF